MSDTLPLIMTAPKPRWRRDPGRRPSAAALRAAANGDWTSHAACRNQPDYTSNNPDSITYTCSRCSVAADCAQLGKLELARAIADTADRGEDRVYAGHQLRDLLLLARRDTAGRQAAYQALDTTLQRAAGFDTFGYNCGCCGRSSAFINDDGRCLSPACREAMA